MDSSEEVYGYVDITYYEVMPILVLTLKEPFFMCSKSSLQVKSLLNFEDEEYVVLHLLFEQGSDSSILLLLWSFCHREETVQPRAHVSLTLGTLSSNEESLQLNILLYKEVYKIYSLLGMKVMISPVVM